MPGLIPLFLNPVATGTRSSVVYAPTPLPRSSQPSVPKLAPRPQETESWPLPMPPVMAQPLARTTSPAAKQRVRRRSQLAPLPVTVLPFTNQEWTKVIAGIKQLYMSRRYRPCSVRCSEILENLKDTASVEPTYLIYLHFYSASSLEMSAKALQTSSPYRTKLLQQARDHYTKADELIQSADESMTRMSRPSSVATSSLHSPAGSNSSRGWTNSTELSSPALSIYSIEDIMLPKQPAPAKKRVAFDLSDEPIIRPDSPTLGFDDLSLYDRPRSLSPPPPPKQPTSILRYDSPSRASDRPSDDDSAFGGGDVDDDPFAVHRSVHRFCGILTSLRRELTSHLAEVEAQLAAPSAPIPWSGRSTPEADRGAADELRGLELQTRIERLRQSGWQRPRFDPHRYERLRETALSELA